MRPARNASTAEGGFIEYGFWGLAFTWVQHILTDPTDLLPYLSDDRLVGVWEGSLYATVAGGEAEEMILALGERSLNYNIYIHALEAESLQRSVLVKYDVRESTKWLRRTTTRYFFTAEGLLARIQIHWSYLKIVC